MDFISSANISAFAYNYLLLFYSISWNNCSEKFYFSEHDETLNI